MTLRTAFATITLTPEQLSAALSRQMNVECKLEVKGLEKVGAKHENEDFVFEISKELYTMHDVEKLHQLAQSQIKEGWVADRYFGSRHSFFTKDDKFYAKCVIRKWTK